MARVNTNIANKNELSKHPIIDITKMNINNGYLEFNKSTIVDQTSQSSLSIVPLPYIHNQNNPMHHQNNSHYQNTTLHPNHSHHDQTNNNNYGCYCDHD